MTADIGREAVYAAEIAAFEGTSHESVVPLDELQRLAAKAIESSWWSAPRIRVVAARSDARSSSTRQAQGEAPVIRLAAPQMTSATVVHELAHVLAGVEHGHDQRFRRAHLDLARFLLGAEPASWLCDGYAAMGLEPGRRVWPPPPVDEETDGPIAL